MDTFLDEKRSTDVAVAAAGGGAAAEIEQSGDPDHKMSTT